MGEMAIQVSCSGANPLGRREEAPGVLGALFEFGTSWIQD